MPGQSPAPNTQQPLQQPPGSGLRTQVEELGLLLEARFSQLLGELPRRIVGPQILANTLGITTVTASRFLKAIGQSNPVAIVQWLPGPNPLQRIVQAAREAGVQATICDGAADAVAQFDELIRTAAGDRSSLKAMLTAWLPEERREFESQRRQSIYKALCELNGISSEVDLCTIFMHPAAKGRGVDLVSAKCLLGIDRIRPDAEVHLGTWRMDPSTGERTQPRVPLTLDGKPALEGMDAVRLNEFCNAPPAPLQAERLTDTSIVYSLAPTGFGPASKVVSLVIGEMSLNELPDSSPSTSKHPYFFSIPEMATRKLVFDLMVHEDVYPGVTPTLMTYDTSSRGPARPGDPSRAIDIKHTPDELQIVGLDHRPLRILEFPAYPKLRDQVFQKLGWAASKFRAYRVEVNYPLTNMQFALVFRA